MTFKKRIWKFLRPPTYEVGIDRYYRVLGKRIHYEKFRSIINDTICLKYTNYEWLGNDIHLILERPSKLHDINIYIRTIPDVSNPEAFHSIIIESKTTTDYNRITDDFLDLLSSLTSIERELIKAMNLEVRKTSMKIKIENITKLDGILKGINAERMTGEIKDSNLWFEYYDGYIQISGEVSSDIVNWLKNLVTYLG